MKRAAAKTREQKQGGKRSLARLAAVQALYELELAGAAIDRVVADFMARRLGAELDGEQYRDADPDWFRDIVVGANQRRVEIDGKVKEIAGRDISRLDVLLRAVLRCATYEMLARVDAPAPIIINEYVDITRSFYEKAEISLVNAILDKLARDLRPGELKDAPSDAGKS